MKEAEENGMKNLEKDSKMFLLSVFEKQLNKMFFLCFSKFVSLYFFLFMSLWLHFPSPSHSHNHINTHSLSLSVISRDTLKETYLALATSSVSVKRKRCLSWVCRPVFSCVWAWPRNRRRGHSARKAWTREHDSGLTGVRQLSLEEKTKSEIDV